MLFLVNHILPGSLSRDLSGNLTYEHKNSPISHLQNIKHEQDNDHICRVRKNVVLPFDVRIYQYSSVMENSDNNLNIHGNQDGANNLDQNCDLNEILNSPRPVRQKKKLVFRWSTGPNSLKGPIGEKLIKCETLPVVQFESIDCQIPEIDKKTLSKDQKYLLEISEAIKSGECPKDLSIRDPGPLSHSRWLTTANRALRLYISQENPTAEFQEIVDELKAVIDPVIERNGFFAHPEHVMITMTQDPRKHIRELGLRRIIKARERDQKRKTIRTYVAPKLNFSATDYTELNDWTNCQFSSPPLLKDVTDDELKTYIKTEEVPKWEILSQKMPVHTQAVERSVKLVSEASAKVCGSAARDGYIRTTLKSRSTMPAFDNKRQFKLPDM
ncbi:hypothetical protein ACJJTC_007576 [Scirpophaga incertulas]